MSTTTSKIRLMVGLANPGEHYQNTRHNAGAWWIEKLSTHYNITLKYDSKFSGYVGKLNDCFLLVPTTFMNLSGDAVIKIINYYDISVEEILIVHDEIDIPVGALRFKKGGGHAGHNGLRDIIQKLNSQEFHRLRIGVGRPPHQENTANYVLSKPNQKEYQIIHKNLDQLLIDTSKQDLQQEHPLYGL